MNYKEDLSKQLQNILETQEKVKMIQKAMQELYDISEELRMHTEHCNNKILNNDDLNDDDKEKTKELNGKYAVAMGKTKNTRFDF